MIAEAQNSFLDVPSLLESSVPKPRGAWLWYAGGLLMLMVLLSAYVRANVENGSQIIEVASTLMMLGLIAGMGALTWGAARAAQREHARIEAIEELVQLRRWSEAAGLLEDTLSRPARSPQARVAALIYLSSVLARYHRYADAIAVFEHLLQEPLLDGQTAHGLRLGRAMAMLQDDRLVDADRAINELRRQDQEGTSGGLGLVEIYRDVKTGHPREAIELFEARRPLMQRQLGHRIADAYALIARARDLVGETEAAQAAFASATLLAPAAELYRRYPEVAVLGNRYAPSPAPAEVA